MIRPRWRLQARSAPDEALQRLTLQSHPGLLGIGLIVGVRLDACELDLVGIQGTPRNVNRIVLGTIGVQVSTISTCSVGKRASRLAHVQQRNLGEPSGPGRSPGPGQHQPVRHIVERDLCPQVIVAARHGPRRPVIDSAGLLIRSGVCTSRARDQVYEAMAAKPFSNCFETLAETWTE